MRLDANDRAAWLQRVVDARLSAEEATTLELLLGDGCEPQLALETVLKVRELSSSCRAR